MKETVTLEEGHEKVCIGSHFSGHKMRYPHYV